MSVEAIDLHGSVDFVWLSQAVHTAQRVTASVAQRSAAAAPASGPAGVNPPPWAADPPPNAMLQATKDAVVVQMVPIHKKATLLGRCDLMTLSAPRRCCSTCAGRHAMRKKC